VIAINVAGEPLLFSGSGGTEYELRGWETARRGHIAYVERQQTEWGPDWDVVRAIIEATSPPP